MWGRFPNLPFSGEHAGAIIVILRPPGSRATANPAVRLLGSSFGYLLHRLFHSRRRTRLLRATPDADRPTHSQRWHALVSLSGAAELVCAAALAAGVRRA